MKEKTKERLIIGGLTALKIAQGVDFARRVKTGKPIIAATIGLAVTDLLDGVIARKLGADGPARRVIDSTTDAGTIVASLAYTYQAHPEARKYISALAVREIFVGAGWAIDLARSGQVKKNDGFHRLSPISVGAFGIAAHQGSERTMRNTGRAALAINAALAWDYYRAWSDPSRTRTLDSGVEEIPGFYDARKLLSGIRGNPAEPAPAEAIEQGELPSEIFRPPPEG